MPIQPFTPTELLLKRRAATEGLLSEEEERWLATLAERDSALDSVVGVVRSVRALLAEPLKAFQAESPLRSLLGFGDAPWVKLELAVSVLGIMIGAHDTGRDVTCRVASERNIRCLPGNTF